MSFLHIAEAALIYIVGYVIQQLISNRKTIVAKIRLEDCLRIASFLVLFVVVWGENHGWSFALRYFLISVSMFLAMACFCLKKEPPTRRDIFVDIVIPLFFLIVARTDFKIKISFSLFK